MEITNNVQSITATGTTPVTVQRMSETSAVEFVQAQEQKVQKVFSSMNGEDADTAKETTGITLGEMKDISKVMNDNTVAEFGVYEPLNRITVKIKDKETGKVLKEIPSEKMLKAFKTACELAGILVDEKR